MASSPASVPHHRPLAQSTAAPQTDTLRQGRETRPDFETGRSVHCLGQLTLQPLGPRSGLAPFKKPRPSQKPGAAHEAEALQEASAMWLWPLLFHPRHDQPGLHVGAVGRASRLPSAPFRPPRTGGTLREYNQELAESRSLNVLDGHNVDAHLRSSERIPPSPVHPSPLQAHSSQYSATSKAMKRRGCRRRLLSCSTVL